jgi:hypothetical protein
MIDNTLRWVEGHPPPGPFRRGFWRSPVRGPWLTAVLGSVLLVGLPIMIVTGLLSYAAYDPLLPGNDATPAHGLLGFFLFDWPTGPTWLYRVTQGAHVALSIALVPVVLAKLCSVIPTLFEWPPARSIAHAMERVTLLILVGGLLFEFVTGLLNSQLDYLFPFFFYTAHFYGAWVFIAGFIGHILVKVPVMVRSLRRGPGQPWRRTSTAGTRPEPVQSALVATAPAPPTTSRRGVLGFVGLSSLVLLGTYVGSVLDGPLRRISLFGPHDRGNGSPDNAGANDFPVNKTAATAGVTPAVTGATWRLELVGPAGTTRLSRDELRDTSAHLLAADRLRRGLVDREELDRRAARRPRRPRRGTPDRPALRRVDAGRGRVRRGEPERRPEPGAAVAAGIEGGGRGPLPRPRLPRPRHGPGGARGALHQVDQVADRDRWECLRCSGRATATTRCTCSPRSSRSRWPGTRRAGCRWRATSGGR